MAEIYWFGSVFAHALTTGDFPSVCVNFPGCYFLAADLQWNGQQAVTHAACYERLVVVDLNMLAGYQIFVYKCYLAPAIQYTNAV